jgi:hypothetical protein
MITGKRMPDRTDDTLDGINPGDYYKNNQGNWEAAVPDPKLPDYMPEYCILPVCANLIAHQVTEHDDGTITVSPSILVSTNWGPNQEYHEYYHGFLERGIWRSV